MTVTLLFFAHLGDIAGGRERELDVRSGATVADAIAVLEAGDERFRGAFAACRYAVNSDWADASRPLCEGDELAFVPPVSGG